MVAAPEEGIPELELQTRPDQAISYTNQYVIQPVPISISKPYGENCAYSLERRRLKLVHPALRKISGPIKTKASNEALSPKGR